MSTPTPITDAVRSVDHLIDTARRLELDRSALMEALEHIARDQGRSMSMRVASPASIAKDALAAARANFPTL